MSFKGIVRELREMKDGINLTKNKNTRRRGKSHIAPDASASSSPLLQVIGQSRWVNLPPELLLDIIQRVEADQTSWPARRDVVACASVCRSWREITKEVVKIPELSSLLTFPISLKQPGPREAPIQCFIKRERATSIFRLYLGLSPALSGDVSKQLLAAKKVRRAVSTEFIISLLADNFSQTSSNYIGKLRSNFLGTKFNIYDSQPPSVSFAQASRSSRRKLNSKQVSPWLSASNYNIASISYELNVLRTRGPRRLNCVMHSIPICAIQESGVAPTPMEFAVPRETQPPATVSKASKPFLECCSSRVTETLREESHGASEPLVLKNKAPRWHEQLQCWCLNFKGRVTVASVKNFQLVAAVEPNQNIPAAEQERVILQFGKIGKDIFTMDYRYPLSAFQAFAICLSSFDTKPACE